MPSDGGLFYNEKKTRGRPRLHADELHRKAPGDAAAVKGDFEVVIIVDLRDRARRRRREPCWKKTFRIPDEGVT